ncbi:MAG: acylphosphatase [Gammaproteobacteria bacterium]|nr:acylphosphatase [Gammaproteobacteria bacterium]
MIARRCLIRGRVQGVYYRGSAARRAAELGVRGYARNQSDGGVEVLACGASDAVQVFIDWLWIGPGAARVTGVEVSEVDLPRDRWPADFTTA